MIYTKTIKNLTTGAVYEFQLVDRDEEQACIVTYKNGAEINCVWFGYTEYKGTIFTKGATENGILEIAMERSFL